MSKLRIIIADDERPAREYLKRILQTFDTVDLVGEASDGADAVTLIKDRKPDLALLDLQMPELSGLEVVKALRKTEMPLVAFVTAFDEYAVRAFEVNAVDYLLKPVERSRLLETIDRAVERLEGADWRQREAENLQKAAHDLTEVNPHETIERIPVRHRDSFLLVPVAEVASIVADGELLRITTNSNQRYVINHRLKDLEGRLAENQFVRLSRGSIVNLDSVAGISPMPGGTFLVTLKNGQSITSSRLQSRVLRTKLLKL